MKRKVLTGFGIIILVILFYAAVKSGDINVRRSIEIKANSGIIYDQINDVRKMNAWSPWLKLDPDVKIDYSGPAAGTNAATSWEGNSEVGKGKMTVIESRGSDLVKFRLDFEKPMAGTNFADFTIRSAGEISTVTWLMYGESSYLCRLLSIFIDMDKMIGDNFEKGLAELKKTAESLQGVQS